MENFTIVQTLLSEELGIAPEKITPESRLVEDLNADSITMMVIVTEIQDKFNIEISNDDIKNTKTVTDIVEFLSARA